MSDFTVYTALYQDDAHFANFGDVEVVHHQSELENKNSILILHGGADISPSIYGQKASAMTHADNKMSVRDLSEVLIAERAIELGIPIFGICRGAQLLCALAGGTLVQHVDNHIGGNHEVITNDGELLVTTTCHHQMMYPFDVKHEMLAWSAPKRSERYIVEHEKQIDVEVEPEVVLFPEIKGLAVQGHPEWMPESSAFVQYCLNLVKERIL